MSTRRNTGTDTPAMISALVSDGFADWRKPDEANQAVIRAEEQHGVASLMIGLSGGSQHKFYIVWTERYDGKGKPIANTCNLDDAVVAFLGARKSVMFHPKIR